MAWRRVRKELLCPACGEIVASAELTRWPGNLVLTSPDGFRLLPETVAVLVRRAQQRLDSPDRTMRATAEDSIAFLCRHMEELVHELRCRRGHTVLRTVPQIARSMRTARGAWVSLEA